MRVIVPQEVIEIREQICEQNNCQYDLDYSDCCSSCPNGHWGPFTICEDEDEILEDHKLKPRVENQFPSLGKMTNTLIGAVKDEILARIDNVSEVEKDEISRRLEICGSCEFISNDNMFRCYKCGCFMNLKTRLRSQHCPINKW